MYRASIYLAITSAMLAPGCCLPQLSGRCEQPAISQAPSARECALGASGDGPHRGDRDHRGHHLGHRGWLAGASDGPGTPPGEVVPLPKFHPVPTHPVFEPQPEYALPRSLERPAAPPHAAPLNSTPLPEALPTPAQPVPDPA